MTPNMIQQLSRLPLQLQKGVVLPLFQQVRWSLRKAVGEDHPEPSGSSCHPRKSGVGARERVTEDLPSEPLWVMTI